MASNNKPTYKTVAGDWALMVFLSALPVGQVVTGRELQRRLNVCNYTIVRYAHAARRKGIKVLSSTGLGGGYLRRG